MAVVTRHIKTPRQARWHAVQWWPTRRLQLDAFAMDRPAVTGFLAEWQRYRPQLMIGYVGAIAELAAMIADGVAPPPPPPKAIAVTAAPLTSTQRQLIESVFAAPVYDHYRSSEVPWIAGECSERNGLHVFADVRALEVVDEAGKPCPPGVTGEVVVSDLTNRVFPLLRYRIGDRAAYLGRDCPCGVTLPLLSPVAGRTTEVLHLPTGQAVAGEGLAQLFSFAPTAVRQFQIHQRADYSIDLRVVRGTAPDAEARIAEAADRFRKVVREAVPVRVLEVESIAHDGGKVRYLSSDVPR
jgi:phenylacetate-CoA ligase